MLDLNDLTLPDLYAHLSASGLPRRLFELAAEEDLGPPDRPGSGDVTSRAMFPALEMARYHVVARRPGVLAGLAAVPDLLHAFRADCDLDPLARDGQPLTPGQTIAHLHGTRRAILAVERTLLNLLGRLSGIATRTHHLAQLITNTPARLYDTRKTTPGLRVLEKYAVRCGGGFCHRLGLHDAALIKDNHLAGLAPSELPDALARAVRRAHDEAGAEGLRFVQVEVDALDQLRAILHAGGCGVHIILLDNMNPHTLAQAVRLRNDSGLRIRLEASGGLDESNLRDAALAGVERLSLGTLTHGSTWLDFGLDAPAHTPPNADANLAPGPAPNPV